MVEKESLNRLRNGFVDGMIVAGTGQNTRIIRDIAVEMPVVQVIRRYDLKMSSVVVDYTDIGYQSVKFLYKQGCSARAKGADDDMIHAWLTSLNTMKCNPPLDDNELNKVISSVCLKPVGRT